MPKYAISLEFYATISVEADSEEEAEEIAKSTDITEVTDFVGEANVVHVEVE